MNIVLGVCNAKGGVGKTTVSMLLAANFHQYALSTVVVDSDPQGTASLWAAQENYPAQVVALDSTDAAAQIERLRNEYDVVVVDCPPNATAPATLATIEAANVLLVPCGPSPADIWATHLLLEAVKLTRPDTPTLVVVNQLTNTVLSRQAVDTIRAQFPAARSMLGFRTAYREAAAMGGTVHALGRAAGAAISELDALTLEIFATLTREAA